MADNEASLSGRVTVVTGAGSGLGRAISCDFAAAGAHVLATDLDAEAAQSTVKLIESSGGSARASRLDVTDSVAVDRFFSDSFEEYGGRLDCLVNNAGTDRGADVPDVEDGQWHGVFAVNAHGPMYTSRAFVRGLLGRDDGAEVSDIVNIVSISALTVGSGAAAYNASKAAALKLTEVLQSEARERSWPVRVAAINPSAMDTPMMDQWHIPSERMMNPANVARLVRVAVTLPPDMVLQSAVVTSRLEAYPR
ncbi:MAG: SDR family NAD(P)-dependent oxidoreductase [Actinomycetales bacterium]